MQTKKCCSCCKEFSVSAEDLDFYRRVSPVFGGVTFDIPSPSRCYECRQRRKLTWRNERTLYHRTCDASGERIMSVYRPEGPFKVYDFNHWFSDAWSARDYGVSYDPNRSFFEQFAELQQSVPLPSLFVDGSSENCDFTNLSKYNRNCYMMFAGNDNEDCYYSTYVQRNRDVVDCFFIFDSELCYECIDCYNCYGLLWSQFCQNCNDSYYLHDCIACSDCFACVGLRNKKHHIFNKPHSPEEYARFVSKILAEPETLSRAQKKFASLVSTTPQKACSGLSNESVSGDHISYSKSAENCFDCTYLEDCKNCTWMHQAKSCYDCYAWGLSGELGYENHLCGDNYFNVRFSEQCFGGISDLLYCRYCVQGCSQLFGCIGLRKQQYCILNTQYSKEEYEALVPKIIERMREDGEWGEFFAEKFSPYGYNETVAQEYYPMEKSEVLTQGWNWTDELHETTGKETLDLKSLASTKATQASEQITKEVLRCTSCARNYRITSGELRFYKKMDLSIPETCFNCRYAARRERRNPRLLWERNCASCADEVSTTYAPQASPVLCEPCYQKSFQ